MQSRKSFLEREFIPKLSLFDSFGADRCSAITAVQPHPLVLFCDRDERTPSWSLGVHRIIPNNVVARLTVAVNGMISIVALP